MASDKIEFKLENVGKAREIIDAAGMGDKIRGISDMHWYEIIKLANKIIDSKANQGGLDKQ